MNTNIIEKNDEKIVVEFELNEIEWNAEIQKSYEREKGHYKVEGFRNGKAPRKVIESMYGESTFFEDAFEHWVNDAYDNYLKENADIKPLFDHPHFDIEKLDKTGVKIKMEIDLTPNFEIGQYKGLDIEKVTYEITDKDVDEEINRMAQGYAEEEDKGGDSVVEDGNIAVIDFTGTIDGEPFDGGSDEDYPLKIGSHSFIDTFEEQLIGLKQGETKDVKVKFPENYGAENLAGKDAVFYVTIKEIKVLKAPELNDEFAVKVGGGQFENFESLKSYVKNEMQANADLRAKHETEDKIMQKILDNTEIKLPQSLIEHELDSVMHDLEYRLMYQGLTLEQYAQYTNSTVDKIREDKRADAEKMAKTNLVMQRIIAQENITLTDEEIDIKLEELAKQSQKTLNEFKKGLQRQQIDYIINDLVVNKIYDVLVKNNNIK